MLQTASPVTLLVVPVEVLLLLTVWGVRLEQVVLLHRRVPALMAISLSQMLLTVSLVILPVRPASLHQLQQPVLRAMPMQH